MAQRHSCQLQQIERLVYTYHRYTLINFTMCVK